MVKLVLLVLREAKVTLDLLDLWDCLVNEVHLASLDLKVNVEVMDQLDRKVLLENKVNVDSKVLWVPLVLQENQLKEVMPDLPGQLANLVHLV